MKITYLEEYHYVIMFKKVQQKSKKKKKKKFLRWTQDLQFIFSTNTSPSSKCTLDYWIKSQINPKSHLVHNNKKHQSVNNFSNVTKSNNNKTPLEKKVPLSKISFLLLQSGRLGAVLFCLFSNLLQVFDLMRERKCESHVVCLAVKERRTASFALGQNTLVPFINQPTSHHDSAPHEALHPTHTSTQPPPPKHIHFRLRQNKTSIFKQIFHQLDCSALIFYW